MKRTILIPLLLSTFLLVGCESELDRCIEANTTDGFFDYDQWSKKHEDYLVKRKIAGENSPLLERGSIWDSIDKMYERSLNDTEADFFACRNSKIERKALDVYRRKDYEGRSVFSIKEAREKIILFEMEQIIRDCTGTVLVPTKASAKKFCNAQGIY